MKMVSCRNSGTSYLCNYLPSRYRLSLRHAQRRTMHICGIQSATMTDGDIISSGIRVTCKYNRSICCSYYIRSISCSNIDSFVISGRPCCRRFSWTIITSYSSRRRTWPCKSRYRRFLCLSIIFSIIILVTF